MNMLGPTEPGCNGTYKWLRAQQSALGHSLQATAMFCEPIQAWSRYLWGGSVSGGWQIREGGRDSCIDACIL